ncbi:MAG: Uma2 family endonuclease [Planctomycetes bacterium]|nr:Uma2 family endonuclease [Planctomycetota bacterium]
MSIAVATARKTKADARTETLADVLRKLGDVPTSRIRMHPFPATEKDVLAIEATENRLFELVDGVLVEKAMGFRESLLAMAIGECLRVFVKPRKLGIVAGADGMLKLSVGLVRIPDVSFVSWKDIPGGKVPKEPIPMLAPTVAVEVLSESNTPAEIKRKRHEYFKAGTSQMWVVDPKKRIMVVWTSVKKSFELTEDDTLDGGNVLPGFKLALRDLFAELDEESPR